MVLKLILDLPMSIKLTAHGVLDERCIPGLDQLQLKTIVQDLLVHCLLGSSSRLRGESAQLMRLLKGVSDLPTGQRKAYPARQRLPEVAVSFLTRPKRSKTYHMQNQKTCISSFRTS